MTLPSLKNLRITRLSRPVWITSLSLAGLVALCMGSAAAQRPGQRYLLTIENNQPQIRLIEGVQQAQDSSLDRLKGRSAQDRFDQIQKQQAPYPGEPLPLREPAESAPIPIAPPAPAENKLPRLPDLDELEEFDPFIEAQKKLQSVQPSAPPTRIGRPVPAPVPAPAPSLTAPVNSGFQDPATDSYQEPIAPDIVRSLSDIQPNYDYQFTVKDDFLTEVADSDPSRVPTDAEFPAGVYQERLSPDSLFAWEASNLIHNPLYFEDPTLERYGHVHQCVQPLVSLTRMGVQLIGLPYQSVIDTPWTERYTLGWYRPGEPAPHLCYQVPLNPEAALAETAAVTAGFLIIP